MSLLKSQIVKGYAENIPQGQYTLHVIDWKEIEPNAVTKKEGYIKLTGIVKELNNNLLNDCRYEKQLEFFFSELKQVYFPDEEVTDVEILDTVVGQDLSIWITYSPNPTNPNKPYRNINYREPYILQAQNLFQ